MKNSLQELIEKENIQGERIEAVAKTYVNYLENYRYLNNLTLANKEMYEYAYKKTMEYIKE